MAGRAGKLEILPIIKKNYFKTETGRWRKEMITHRGERETELDVKEGKCNFACFIDW